MKKRLIIIGSFLSIIGFSSCDRLLEVTPPNETLAEDALKTPEDLQKMLNSCYDVLANSLNGRTQIFNELLGDNLNAPRNNDDFREIYNRSSNFFNNTVGSLYADYYIAVFRVNVMLAAFDQIPALSDAEENRMRAEGYFVRALSYFELVKLWAQPYGYSSGNGHPGIVIRSEATQNPLPRNTVEQVYNQIISDLEFAANNLPDNNGNYADKVAARALLAKVYFQMNRFDKVIENVDIVVNSGRFSLSDSLNRFNNTATQSEYIFTFISTSNNDNRARTFVDNYRSDNNATPQLTVTQEFYDLVNSSASDQRARFFTINNPGTENEAYVTTKFNQDFFSIPYLHLTDLLLMRAEAYGELNINLDQAKTDLNDIMERAYGPGVKVLDASANGPVIIQTARYERRIELVFEGNRVQDLKRIGAKGEPVNIRGAVWNCNGMILQFPISENTAGFQLNIEGGCN